MGERTKYEVSTLIDAKNRFVAEPPELRSVPNIVIPDILKGRNNRLTPATLDGISADIRPFFNSVTQTTLAEFKEKLRKTVIEKAHTHVLLAEIASEILEHFWLITRTCTVILSCSTLFTALLF